VHGDQSTGGYALGTSLARVRFLHCLVRWLDRTSSVILEVYDSRTSSPPVLEVTVFFFRYLHRAG
jgi:hypothetical protein